MGINNIIKEYEERNLKLLRIPYEGLEWCELGNQNYYKKSAKKIYKAKGVNHTSIDLNGKNGALEFDLDYPLPIEFENKFDVVTNYGTIEHVNNQYSVFKNVHIICKLGGIIIHLVPLINNWKDHCRYYYTEQFFKDLSYQCNYRIIDVSILKEEEFKDPYNLVVCVLIKKFDNFISEDVFNQINGVEDSKDLTQTGNYTKRIRKPK